MTWARAARLAAEQTPDFFVDVLRQRMKERTVATVMELPVYNTRAERNGDVIRILTDLLERAQQGEIQELGVAWVNDKGYCGNNRSVSDNLPLLLGSITMLHFDLATYIQDNLMQTRESDEGTGEDEPA